MARHRRRAQMQLNAEINVVSLIDVMLLLLVIFMLTAPMMTGGLDLTLPTADSKPLDTKSGLTVSIDKSGMISVNGQAMSFTEFKGVFSTYAKARGKDGVDLRADKSTSYELVIRVMAVINAAGISNIGLMTEPEEIAK